MTTRAEERAAKPALGRKQTNYQNAWLKWLVELLINSLELAGRTMRGSTVI